MASKSSRGPMMTARDRGRAQLLRVFAFMALFTVAVLAGRMTRLPGTQLALLWPAAGVAFLWIASGWPRPARVATDAALLCLLAGALNAATGVSTVMAVVLGPLNAAQAVLACLLFSRLGRSRRDWRARTLADVAVLALAGLLAAVATGLVAALALAVTHHGGFLAAWGSFVLRNASNAFVVAVLGLRLREPCSARTRPSALRVLELAGLLVTSVGLLFGVFGPGRALPMDFLVVPLAVWMGQRLSTTAAAMSAAAFGGATTVLSLLGHGPFAGLAEQPRGVLTQLSAVLLVALAVLVALSRDDRVAIAGRMDAAHRQLSEQADLLRAVVDGSTDGILVVDAAGRYLRANPAAAVLYTGSGINAPDGRDVVFDRFAFTSLDGQLLTAETMPVGRALRGETVRDLTMVANRRRDGRELTLSVSASPLPGGGAVSSMRDVSATHAFAREAARVNELLTGVLAAATEQAVVVTDPDGRITLFNVGAERMTGWCASEVLGSALDRLHEQAEIALRARQLGTEPGLGVFVHSAVAGGTETRIWTWVRKDGSRLKVRLTVTAIRDAGGGIDGFLGMAGDVTEQLAVTERLIDSEERFRSTFWTAPMSMALVGLEGPDGGRLLQSNPRLADFVGRAQHDLVGLELLALVHPQDRDAAAQALAALRSGQHEETRAELRLLSSDGTERWATASASAVRPCGDEPPYLILCLEDITARRAAEQLLTHQALHDSLTGLPNRALATDRLTQALERTARSSELVGVLYLDLDGFKEVNDSAGHARGDQVLQEVGERLRHAVRPTDTVARLGGDEFVVICPQMPTVTALRLVAERVLAAVDRPFAFERDAHQMTVSIGMVTARAAEGPEQVLSRADDAMYQAKRAGKNQIVGDGARAGRPADRASRLSTELRRALRENTLVMHGQPVVDLQTEQVVAVETLLRWQHPERGLLPPSQFLDVVESGPLMLPVGRRVLEESCRMGATWAELLAPGGPSVHVNVSGRQLEDGSLTRTVEQVLARTSLPADRLVLELTETHTPKLADTVRRDLAALRERGIRIAIDDIGTGYSSLTRLTELPVDVLKIDLRFVAGLGRDPSCDAVVRAVLGIGAALGLSVVAEGIETPFQAARLRELGCDTGQGYLFSPPRPEAELTALLSRRQQPVLPPGWAI